MCYCAAYLGLYSIFMVATCVGAPGQPTTACLHTFIHREILITSPLRMNEWTNYLIFGRFSHLPLPLFGPKAQICGALGSVVHLNLHALHGSQNKAMNILFVMIIEHAYLGQIARNNFPNRILWVRYGLRTPTASRTICVCVCTSCSESSVCCSTHVAHVAFVGPAGTPMAPTILIDYFLRWQFPWYMRSLLRLHNSLDKFLLFFCRIAQHFQGARIKLCYPAALTLTRAHSNRCVRAANTIK